MRKISEANTNKTQEIGLNVIMFAMVVGNLEHKASAK